MTLELPADIEPHLGEHNHFDWNDPAVYCLRLEKPDDPRAAWNATFDTEAPYLEDIEQCSTLLYVGATGRLLSRLEDHREGDVRVTTLTEICEIDSLRNVWWFNDAQRAFERESGIAIQLQNEYPDYYVHSR